MAHEPLLIDVTFAAVMRTAGSAPQEFPTLHEAVMEWLRMEPDAQHTTTIVSNGRLYQPDEIHRIHKA